MRQLTTIQTELKGRIEESRAVDNKDFVWVKIREEALKDRSSEVVTEEWRILIVKTENESSLTGETHHETECNWNSPDKDDNREKIPNHSHNIDDEVDDATFAENNESDDHSFQPPAAQQSPLTSPDDDDDDIEDIKFVTDFNPLDFQLPNRNPNHSSSNVTTVPRAKGYFYACQQCSYQCNTKSDFQAHLLLHEEGSGAIPCHDCGRPVLPEKMERHLSVHSIIGTYRQRSRAWKVRKSKDASQPSINGSNESVAEIGTSSSNLSAGKYYYQCKQCPFESNSSVRFDKHVKLHENGSGAVPCEDCGFYLDPTKVGLHRAKRHNYRRDRSAKKKKLGVKKK
ncbi:putative zinc finger protein [Orchesella cincta]|uniref:Putative zinc finger protein n=1 Tax=Orchesella cincta TaxID=48709 RepID=A0A1D2ME00_ORCCI|nr:putative zinc finger protein [Orchesella cincta]